MSKDDDRDLINRPIRRVLFDMSWPMTVGIVATMSVSLADAFFLGRQSTTALAAISFTFPVVLTLMSLAIGLGAGTSSVVSRAIGADDQDNIKLTSTAALVLCIVITSLLALIGFFTIRPLFGLLGASGETLDLVETYMRIWYFGLPFLAVMMVANNLLRASGDPRSPAVMMIMVAAINVGLNAVLIPGFGPVPAYGIAGAGWASLIARLGALLMGLWLIIYREQLVDLASLASKAVFRAWYNVATVAIPAALGNAVNPVGIALVTAIVAQFGDEAVAAFGTASRIESFISIPMLAMSAAIGPIAGQNFGAGKVGRVVAALRNSYAFSAGWSIFIAAALWFAAPSLATLFTSDQAVSDLTALYLRIIPISLAGYGVTVVASGAFNAIGRPFIGLSMYLVRTAIFYVPLAWLAVQFGQERDLFIAIALANVLAGLTVAFMSVRVMRRYKDD